MIKHPKTQLAGEQNNEFVKYRDYVKYPKMKIRQRICRKKLFEE